MSDQNYADAFSEKGFWEKLADFALAAGREVSLAGLKLYYTTHDPNCPAWAKTTAGAALGYFIFPLDAIPDPVPVVGFADDLGVLTLAIATIAAHVTDDACQKAEETLKKWF